MFYLIFTVIYLTGFTLFFAFRHTDDHVVNDRSIKCKREIEKLQIDWFLVKVWLRKVDVFLIEYQKSFAAR